MDCLNCGAPLHKNDIFCINCETPVLTDDDLERLANMDFSSSNGDIQDTLTMSASDRLFNGLSFEEDTLSKESPGENQSDSDYVSKKKHVPKKNTNRKAIIITAVAMCLVAIGIGIFFWLRPSPPPVDGPDSQDPPEVITNGGEKPGEPSNGGDTSPPPVDITATGIILMSGGRVQTEFHVSVGQSLTLTARLEPDGAKGDITWSSSDPEILEVTQAGAVGTEATITGKATGVEDIILTFGDIEMRYVVFVDNLPVTAQFENAINDDSTAIWLTISWLDPEQFGREIVFERDLDTQTWTMESTIERGEVDPTFGNENGVVTLRFPDSDNMYYLFDDNMGFYGTPNGPDNEEFIWWFKTSLIEPEG